MLKNSKISDDCLHTVHKARTFAHVNKNKRTSRLSYKKVLVHQPSCEGAQGKKD